MCVWLFNSVFAVDMLSLAVRVHVYVVYVVYVLVYM